MASGASRVKNLESGATWVSVTPSDTADLTNGECRCLYIDTEGTLKVVSAAGDTVGPVNVVAGTYFLCRVTRVFDTDTTATVWAVY